MNSPKRHAVVAAAIALLFSALSANAQDTYLIDFNDTADGGGGGYPAGSGTWNAYADPTDITGAAIVDNNNSSIAGITLDKSGIMANSGNGLDNTFNNPTGGPAWVTDSTTLANTDAAADYFWTSFNAGDSFTVHFGNLPTGATSSIDLWFSRVGTDPTGFFEYSVDGGTTWEGFDVLEKDGSPVAAGDVDLWDTQTTQDQSFQGERDGNIAARYMNASNVVTAGGTLDIRTTNSRATWSAIAAIRLIVQPADADVAIVTQPTSKTVTEFLPATFGVGATGDAPITYQWYRVGSPDMAIAGADQFSYTIPETSLTQSGDEFYVVVANDSSSQTSETVTLTVDADTVAPAPIFAGTPDGTAIVITFSEPLDATTGAAAASYSFSDSGGSIAITGVALSAGATEVTLTLAEAAAGAFTADVSGVTDRVGNAAAPTTVSGEAPLEGAISYLFDFGGAATTTGPYPADPFNAWNNVTSAIGGDDSGQLDGVITTGGDTTSINLAMISRFSATNSSGHFGSTLYPGTAAGDSLYGHTELFNGLSDVFPSFKLTGLDQSLAHTFTFYAARLGVGDNREAEYTITGADGDVVVNFNPANNETDQRISAAPVYPDENGEIVISIGPGANNDNSNHFTYLNVLRLDTAPGDRAPLRTIGYTFEEGTGAMSITWTSRGDATYSIFYSDITSALRKEGDITDSVNDNDEEDADPAVGIITHEFQHPDPGAKRLFFTVYEN